MAKLTYGTLPRNPRPNVCLWCPWCIEQYSACRGDYFTRDQNEVPVCGECGREKLVLVERRLVRIRPEQAESSAAGAA
jgi:hypothetical protein